MPKFTVPQKLKISRKGGVELIEVLYHVVKSGKKGISANSGSNYCYNHEKQLRMLLTFGLIEEIKRLIDQTPKAKASFRKAIRQTRALATAITKAKTSDDVLKVVLAAQGDEYSYNPVSRVMLNRPATGPYYIATKAGIKVCNEAEISLVGGEETEISF